MDRHVLIMTFGKIHDAPEFRIRCLPRDKQTSVVVHIPRKVWIGGSILALLNLLSLFLFLINVI